MTSVMDQARVQPEPRERASQGRWTDVFRYDGFVHAALMASIIAATFQGYLKDRIGGPLPYVFSDAAFMLAALLWFAGLAIRHLPVRGPGWTPHLVLVILFVPTLYLLHPGTPLVIEMAGLRAWVEFPVACLIALTIIRTPAQARAYVGLILMLCVITAMYGIMQYFQGPQSALDTALGQLRHGNTVFFNTSSGGSQFRAFSTFTFPAPFAGMMVFGMLLAAGIALSTNRSTRTRLFTILLIPLFFAGMTVSGTRAALITLALGLVLLAWYRGLSTRYLFLIPVLLLAAHLSMLITTGQLLDRFATVLLEENQLWARAYHPVTIAAQSLSEHPFGTGLGRTGVGVPFGIVNAQGPGYFVFSDGDIGRASVEMGVVGLVLVVIIIFGLIPYAARSVKTLVGTEVEDIALGIGALVVATSVIIFIGSPLSSAPHGIIWWLLLGTLFKLDMLEREPRRRVHQ